MSPVAAVELEIALGQDLGGLLLHIHHGHAVGAGIAGIEAADDERGIRDRVPPEHAAQDGPVAVGGRFGTPAVAFLIIPDHGPVHVLAARRLGDRHAEPMRRVGPILGEDRA